MLRNRAHPVAFATAACYQRGMTAPEITDDGIAVDIARTDLLVSTGWAAQAFGVTAETVRRWHARGIGPARLTLPSGHARYRLADVLAYRADLTATASEAAWAARTEAAPAPIEEAR